MLTINADDWGRSETETAAALSCYRERRITAVSAMVFMGDSARAAELAKEHGIDTGLHLNFSEAFTGQNCSGNLKEQHRHIVSFLRRNKYTQLFYNPFLAQAFAYSYQAQSDEFARLFGRLPSRVDGHHHMHLCANVLIAKLIPAGVRVRRNFSFWPGEKSLLNRSYRSLIDRKLARTYCLADYFFDLTQSLGAGKLERVARLAESHDVELMTHPALKTESDYLLSDKFYAILRRLELGGCAVA